ncbi:MAG: albusnodin family lasso peptide [Sciscionella sp.]
MTTATNSEPAPIAGVDHPVVVSELIVDLGDAAAMTQGPNGGGSDGKRYLYQ